MDYVTFFVIFIFLDLLTITLNQQAVQSPSAQDDKPDRAFRPGMPVMGPPGMRPPGMENVDPIENSYQRLPYPGDPNLMGRPGDVRIPPPTGNFPGDQPPPGIPAQPAQSIDRHFPGVIGDNCLFKLRYYMASCEDALLQRQRDARNARTAPDIQRRMCCSLYYYYDCMSKLVIQYCRDASPMVVNLVMPENRRRELAINCRTHTRDQCNTGSNLRINFSTLSIILSFIPIIIAFGSSFSHI
ncbi:uncharacterized protein LOC141852261 [Brevipalpus obovatus]|uniref:uncharacterized protein LOC141852261 n=1 Tax=Brevipalpus obovatus TaxID=246614 RepID=UPI003D9DD42C